MRGWTSWCISSSVPSPNTYWMFYHACKFHFELNIVSECTRWVDFFFLWPQSLLNVLFKENKVKVSRDPKLVWMAVNSKFVA